MRQTVSACLIVRNEEERLPDALASVSFCDEIVVVDAGSTDRTVAIACAAGARVVESPWRGFAAQRNVALDHASCDWILEVDADERVTPTLRAAIQHFVKRASRDHVQAALAIRHVLFGRALGPAAQFPDYKLRLFRRGAFRHDERRLVHEGLPVVKPITPLSGELLHLRAGNLGEALYDCWRYARLEARHTDLRATVPALLHGLFVRPPQKIAWRLLVDGGWRDGWRGAVLIALDCVSDCLVWLWLATGPSRGKARARHFAVRPRGVGAVRIVGLAAGTRDARRATAWLQRATRAGADVALIADTETPGIRVRRIGRIGMLPAIRALEAEHRLGAVDALLVVGWRGRILAQLLPGRVRGTATPAIPDE
jgi:hypothetical protein